VWGCGVVAGAVCGGSGVWALVSAVGAGDCFGMYTYFQHPRQVPERRASMALCRPRESLTHTLKRDHLLTDGDIIERKAVLPTHQALPRRSLESKHEQPGSGLLWGEDQQRAGLSTVVEGPEGFHEEEAEFLG